MILNYFDGGTDTSDATATQDEICIDKTAYIATGKVTGTGDIVHTVSSVPATKDTSIIKLLNTTDYYAWKENGVAPPSGGVITIPIETRTLAVSLDSAALVTPYVFDFNVGYIASSTTQQQQATAVWTYESPTNSYSDLYILDPLSVYWVGLGSTIGTRFRVGYFNEDPTTRTTNMTGTLVEYKNNLSAWDCKFFTTNAPWNNQTKYLVIQKDNVGTTGLKSYLVKIGVSAGLQYQY